MSEGHRARDPGLTAWDLNGWAWVVCPRCQGPARSADEVARGRFRLACRRCAHVAEMLSLGGSVRIGDATDGRFGLPLYLTTGVRGHRLWVYNVAHLDALAGWLGSTLRERPSSGVHRNKTMMARLPPWMTSARARPEIVKALAGLRARAVAEGLA
jgi:hypothetical protein